MHYDVAVGDRQIVIAGFPEFFQDPDRCADFDANLVFRHINKNGSIDEQACPRH